MSEKIHSICLIAICGSLISALPESKALQNRLRMVTGLFLILAIGTSVLNLSFDGVGDALRIVSEEGAAACQEGVELNSENFRRSISEQVQTYIEDKAFRLGIPLKAEVTVSQEGLPRQAVLYAAEDRTLAEWIQSELGITKENQLWIGVPSTTE